MIRRKLVKSATCRDVGRYERLLLVKRNGLSVAQGERRPLVPPASVSEGDLMDCASADVEAELQVHLRQTDGRLLKAIDDALTRLRTKTFGVCETCNGAISKARLGAVPWTRQCRECKEREESGGVMYDPGMDYPAGMNRSRFRV
jgi:RNA polymerase-binding protein DksA